MGTDTGLLAHWPLAGDCRLELHVDGSRVATSAAFDASAFDLSTDQPLRIGAGAIDTFNGRIRDLRLYRRALAEDEIGRLAS